MKFILVLALTISIFSDFASTSFSEDESISHAESTISCTDVDLHNSTDEGHESHEGEEHHCHAGHFHNLVINSSINIKIQPAIAGNLSLLPTFSLGTIQKYISDINRPPISESNIYFNY